MSQSTPTPGLTTLRIVVGAMMGGVFTFAVIAYALAGPYGIGRSEPDDQLAHILMLVLAALGLGLLVAYPLVRRTLIGKLRGQWRGGAGPAAQDETLVRNFSTLTIVGAAMAEGFALFATVIYLVSAQPASLIGAVIGLAALSRFFPTIAAVDRFASQVAGQTIA